MRQLFRASLLCLVGGLLAPALAGAALTEDDFFVKNTQDLVDLCSAPESDPLQDASEHFCHGFISGAWQYHEAMANGPEGKRLVCPVEPYPTRNDIVAGFVTWANANPAHMAEPPVEALFRYLIQRAPCPAAAKKGASK
jgi:hypothetical protein